MPLPPILDIPFREAGIAAAGLVGQSALRETCSYLPPQDIARLGIENAIGAVAAALPYGEGPDSPPAWAVPFPGPLARLARFARAHWYAELSARLKVAASRIRERLRTDGADPGPEADWRFFSNSRLPERRLALEAGLGRLGRHGLVMVPSQGSAAVLGLLLLPARLAPFLPRDHQPIKPYAVRQIADSESLDPDCKSCRACVAACPTGALKPGGGFERRLCIQHWSAIPGRLPPAVEQAWGDRLYGCETCQEACPRFRPEALARTDRGLLGPGLPAGWLTAASEAEIRRALRGSALGMSWIAFEALKRSAALALAAGSGEGDK